MRLCDTHHYRRERDAHVCCRKRLVGTAYEHLNCLRSPALANSVYFIGPWICIDFGMFRIFNGTPELLQLPLPDVISFVVGIIAAHVVRAFCFIKYPNFDFNLQMNIAWCTQASVSRHCNVSCLLSGNTRISEGACHVLRPDY